MPTKISELWVTKHDYIRDILMTKIHPKEKDDDKYWTLDAIIKEFHIHSRQKTMRFPRNKFIKALVYMYTIDMIDVEEMSERTVMYRFK